MCNSDLSAGPRCHISYKKDPKLLSSLVHCSRVMTHLLRVWKVLDSNPLRFLISFPQILDRYLGLALRSHRWIAKLDPPWEVIKKTKQTKKPLKLAESLPVAVF